MRLPGEHVDVNLHPTKREVGFLHQEELTEAVCSAIQDRLTKSNDQCALLVNGLVSLRIDSWDTGIIHRILAFLWGLPMGPSYVAFRRTCIRCTSPWDGLLTSFSVSSRDCRQYIQCSRLQ